MPELQYGAVIGGLVGGAVSGGGFVFALSLLRSRKHCAVCGVVQPRFRLPRTVRQWAWGGWTCRRCGTELDRQGRRV